MQLAYELLALAEYRITHNRAQAERERMIAEARRANRANMVTMAARASTIRARLVHIRTRLVQLAARLSGARSQAIRDLA